MFRENIYKEYANICDTFGEGFNFFIWTRFGLVVWSIKLIWIKNVGFQSDKWSTASTEWKELKSTWLGYVNFPLQRIKIFNTMKIIRSDGFLSIVKILRQVIGELIIDSSSVVLWRNFIKVSMNIAVYVKKYVRNPAKRLKVGNKMESRRLPNKDSNWTKTLSSTSPVFSSFLT